MSALHGRRSFVSAMASLTGLAVARLSAGQQPAGQQAAASTAGFDMGWLEQLKGKHRQLYDLGGHELSGDPRPLRFARNFLDTFRDVSPRVPRYQHSGRNLGPRVPDERIRSAVGQVQAR